MMKSSEQLQKQLQKPYFVASNEELSGSTTTTTTTSLKNLQYYVHDDLRGVEPSVDTLSVPPPGMITIYRCCSSAKTATTTDDTTNGDNNNTNSSSLLSLEALGRSARSIIDDASLSSSSRTDALLFRGIPATTASEFSIFWQACKRGDRDDDNDEWRDAEYVNFGRPRTKQSGVDAATNVPRELTLNPHNELSYNPVRPNRIGLFCLQPSAKGGGETIIARNKDITNVVPLELIQYVQNHGGILYERTYRDANNNNNSNSSNTANNSNLSKQLTISWQEKCGGVQTREEAERYWIDRGFQREHLSWDDDGTLRVRNIESGFIIMDDDDDANDDNDDDDQKQPPKNLLWFNNIDTVGTCSDGTGRPPKQLLELYQANRWKVCYAWRLEAGDWLVLNNKRMQHGRLPYPTGVERRLLTVLTV